MSSSCCWFVICAVTAQVSHLYPWLQVQEWAEWGGQGEVEAVDAETKALSGMLLSAQKLKNVQGSTQYLSWFFETYLAKFYLVKLRIFIF